MNSLTLKIDKKDITQIKNFLTNNNFNFKDNNNEYILLLAKKDKITITLYTSNKLLIQGSIDDSFINNLKTELNFNNIKIKNNPILEKKYNIIGNDEVGKGDFFGGLVVSSVYIDKNQYNILKKYKITDSKKISDKKILELEPIILKHTISETYAIEPKIYNKLYIKYPNLNLLLANAHSYVIKKLIDKLNNDNIVDTIIIDKFCNEKYFINSFKKNNINIDFNLIEKAESNITVACASCLARAQFLKMMNNLSQKYNIELPKGATFVKDVAYEIIKKYGKKELENLAKIHFKTYKELI